MASVYPVARASLQLHRPTRIQRIAIYPPFLPLLTTQVRFQNATMIHFRSPRAKMSLTMV